MCLTKQLNPVFRIPRISVETKIPGASINGTEVVAKSVSCQDDKVEVKASNPSKRVISEHVVPTAAAPSVHSSSNLTAVPPETDTVEVCSNVSNEEAKYHYRDFSRARPDDGECVLDVISHMPSSALAHTDGTMAHGIKHQKLPVKLNAMLSDKGFSHIIAWMPHGRSWRILKPKQFVKEVLPKYFDYCNYNSFIRLVNAWGFRRFSSGPDRHSYYHELFLRNLPHLHSRMRRVTGKDKKPPVDQDDEPDLYEISRLNPLPEDDVKKSADDVTATPSLSVASSTLPKPGGGHGSNPVVAPKALKATNETSISASSSTWQSSVSDRTVPSNYAAVAFAEHLRQQSQCRATDLSSRQSVSQTQAPQTLPYTQYPHVPHFNSVMNPQPMNTPRTTESNSRAPAADLFELTASQICMQQVLQQMDASRMPQLDNTHMQQQMEASRLQQMDASRLQQLLVQSSYFGQQVQAAASKKQSSAAQQDNGYSMLTHGHGPKNSRGESPIMYIPVYPSTLASLSKLTSGLGTPGSDSS